MKEVNRTLNNLSTCAGWQTTLNKKEVEFLFNNYSGTVFCRGHLRQIVATPITDNCYQITSKSMF